jgi:BASS family bile acid:Na+ symporter
VNRDTLIFIVCSYGAMLLGICLPQFGEPLRHLLTMMLMVQLLLCFLDTGAPDAVASTADVAGLPAFLGIKMLLTPLICWGIFALILPRYALGAILMGGVSIGVTAPFFGRLARADVTFIIAGVVASCLILPLTMPVLVVSYLYAAGQEAGSELWAAFFKTGLALALYIFVPFAVARGMWKTAPALAKGILNRRYVISVSSIACCMFVIFSRFSTPLRANPFMVAEALAGAFVLAVIFLGVGIFAGRGMSAARSVACAVSMGTANNGLVLILSAQLFGLPEVLVTAMYSVPLFLLLIPYQRYAAWKENGRRPDPYHGAKKKRRSDNDPQRKML